MNFTINSVENTEETLIDMKKLMNFVVMDLNDL